MNFIASVGSGIKRGIVVWIAFLLVALATSHFPWQDMTLGALVVAILKYAQAHLEAVGHPLNILK